MTKTIEMVRFTVDDGGMIYTQEFARNNKNGISNFLMYAPQVICVEHFAEDVKINIFNYIFDEIFKIIS